MTAKEPGGGLTISHALVALIVSVVTATVTLTGSFFSTRDALQAENRQALVNSETRQQTQLADKLQHYVTQEAFLNWQRKQESSESRNYYALLAAIDRLNNRIAYRSR